KCLSSGLRGLRRLILVICIIRGYEKSLLIRHSLLRQRIRPQLEVHCERLLALSAFAQPGRTIAAGGPQSTTFPAGIRVVDAAVESLCVKTQRVRNAKDDHLSILHCDQAIVLIARGHGDVFTQPECVVLVDPRVVTRFGAVRTDAFKSRSGILIERPTLRTMISCRLRPIQRTFALASIEASQMAARERNPHDSVL